jgi:hypothetical protein
MDQPTGICGQVRALYLLPAVAVSFAIAAGCRVHVREAEPNDPDVEWFDPGPEFRLTNEKTVPEDAAE